MRALVCAQSYGSISIPAISSGVHGFPINVCADTLIQAVVDFSEIHEDSELTDIYFIIQLNASAFQRAMEKHIVTYYVTDEHNSCTFGTMTMCVAEPLIVCEPLYVTCV